MRWAVLRFNEVQNLWADGRVLPSQDSDNGARFTHATQHLDL